MRHPVAASAFVATFLLLGQAAPAHAETISPFNVADCSVTDNARVLRPDPNAKLDARAYWLNGDTVRWPGLASGSTVRLIVDGKAIELSPSDPVSPAAFQFTGNGPEFKASGPVRDWLRGDVLVEALDAQGRATERTRLQHPGALDALYADAVTLDTLGVRWTAQASQFQVWAPTAQQLGVCVYNGTAASLHPMTRDAQTGAWSAQVKGDLWGQHYRYLVDVFTPGHGLVRSVVTDPYSISLDTDSQHSWIGDPSDARLKPKNWDTHPAPRTVAQNTDMTIYELHVRDFSRDDATVPQRDRGKLTAFTRADSAGMRHLRALAKAGLTDVHLLPIFDFATLPERDCVQPRIPASAADSEAQQAAIRDIRDRDCYNWGYEPFHFNAVEGSYSTNPNDGAVRIRELRQAVMALHGLGLRVGMDVVYNHTNAAGLDPRSVLDRLVPGYYHRLNTKGQIERSTCCENTATEHRMMGKLLIDSVAYWTRVYRIDSFRFDLMAHQPRDVMEQALTAAQVANRGVPVQFLGEGWNFGEIANGQRFVQASQLSLNGSGIGTFSDRARDAVRGGSAGDSGADLVSNPGFIHRRLTAKDAIAWDYADWVRIGMAGSLRGFDLADRKGAVKPAQDFSYKGAPAAYVSQPQEVVNYVENHDNQTLFDLNAIRMPAEATAQQRVQAQWLAIAINAVSQGIAYYHAGIDVLRSKSLDRNSYNSGDWFNRIDWSGRTNYFGTGLPPEWDNQASWPQMRAALNNPNNRVTAAQIAQTQRFFRDWLAIRHSSTLFRLQSAEDIRRRLSFPTDWIQRDPRIIVAQYDGRGLQGARFANAMVIINAATQAQTIALTGTGWKLHPVLAARTAADPRLRQVRIRNGAVTVPAYMPVVLVRD